jgi:Bacterial SH3 domain
MKLFIITSSVMAFAMAIGKRPTNTGAHHLVGWATIPLFALTALVWLGIPVRAQSVDPMLNECSRTAQNYFRDWEARTDMNYTGQRVDGTHAINGMIFLETRFEDFACSYERSGRRMVEFFAEGRLQNAYLPKDGGLNRPGNATGPSMVQVTGVPVNDVLNVRHEPSPRARIVGALSNGTTVRNLGCRNIGGSTWCRIQMLDDMGGEGWVNARFLNREGVATQLPEPVQPLPPTAGQTRTVRVQFPTGTNNTQFRGSIAPGGSVRYVLNARNGLFLNEQIAGNGLTYQIFNPDNSFLLDQIPVAREYTGQLWQSGNHVIEVINRSNRSSTYSAYFGVN